MLQFCNTDTLFVSCTFVLTQKYQKLKTVEKLREKLQNFSLAHTKPFVTMLSQLSYDWQHSLVVCFAQAFAQKIPCFLVEFFKGQETLKHYSKSQKTSNS